MCEIVFFEKYSTSGKDTGTGLGTYSAKLMANIQGGDIGFESTEQTGTCLIISLPRARN
jgi:signal transduction histidine kinase